MRVRRFASLLAVCVLIPLFGCSSSDDPVGPPTTPPKTPLAVDDLRVTAGADGEVTLAWTSPQLEDKADYSVRYDLRSMPYGSEGAAWDQWVPLDAPSNDTAPGISHSFVVRDLTPGSVSVFMMTASSDGTDWSGASNMAVGTASPDFDTTAPDPITDLIQTGGTSTTLKFRWSTTGDDGPYGHAPHYQIRYSLAPITEENWDAATFHADVSVTGTDILRHTITELTPDTEYYIAVKATDDSGNISDLSNVEAMTTVTFRVLEVFVDGSGDYATIEAALRYSEPGDLILVGPGRYTWTNQGTGDPQTGLINTPARLDSVELRSTHGAAETILDAEKNGAIMSITGGTVDPPGGERYWTGITVDGFTFTGGLADGFDSRPGGGGGINAHLTDSVIRNCVFKGNEALNGGGLWVGGQGEVVVEDCLFINNKGESGGAIMLINSAPEITIRNCVIRNNYAIYQGGGILAYRCNFTIEDCLIFENEATDKGGAISIPSMIKVDRNPEEFAGVITGCTLAKNKSEVGAAIFFQEVPEFLVTNTIMAFNSGGPEIKGVVVTGLDVGCTNVFGNPDGVNWPSATVDLGGNIELDPLFCNLASFMLRSDSPCLPAHSGCGPMGARGQGCTP